MSPKEPRGKGGAEKLQSPASHRSGRPPAMQLWVWIGAVAGVVVFALLARRQAPGSPQIKPAQDEFFHDQMVEWTLQVPEGPARSALRKMTLWTWVEKDGQAVVTVGKIARVPLRYDHGAGLWRARWPSPWNAPDGEYHIRVDTASFPPDLPPLRPASFQIVSRRFDPVPPGFGVLVLEDMASLNNMPAPDGTRKNFTALVDWAEYIGADAVMIQGGESSGYGKKLPDDFPWYARPDKALRDLGQECHRRGLKFGVYALCFLIGGPAEFAPSYAYGWDYRSGRLVNGLEMPTRRGISITDPKRVEDIVRILRRWHDMEEVDWVGLDYIRPVFGGFELAGDFVRDMPVDPPPGWAEFSPQQKMLWLAKARLPPSSGEMNVERNPFIDKWFWYRAHRTAQVVRRIRAGLAPKKPLWAFTLSWAKGWQHGQDPVMMRDAGIDWDAIMLYEADTPQFRALVKQWNEYTLQSQVNLLVGDVIDWVLHQRTLNPAGPEDFFNRNMKAIREFHSDGPVRGLFIHDFTRARRGRIAPYQMREWLLAGGAALTNLRALHRRLPYTLAFTVPDQLKPGERATGFVAFGENPSAARVTVQLSAAPDVEVWPAELELTPENSSVAFNIRYAPNSHSPARGHRSYVAARAVSQSAPAVLTQKSRHCQIYMKYFQGLAGVMAGPVVEPETPEGPVSVPAGDETDPGPAAEPDEK
jgi:hypothetical protein